MYLHGVMRESVNKCLAGFPGSLVTQPYLVAMSKVDREVLRVVCGCDALRFAGGIDVVDVFDKLARSLDVRSLFTNVPLKETFKSIGSFIEISGMPVKFPIDELK